MTNAGKKQMPQAGFEPTTPWSHERCSSRWATEATTVEWVKKSTVHTVILGLITTDNKTNYLSCWDTIHSFGEAQNICLGEVWK